MFPLGWVEPGHNLGPDPAEVAEVLVSFVKGVGLGEGVDDVVVVASPRASLYGKCVSQACLLNLVDYLWGVCINHQDIAIPAGYPIVVARPHPSEELGVGEDKTLGILPVRILGYFAVRLDPDEARIG